MFVRNGRAVGRHLVVWRTGRGCDWPTLTCDHQLEPVEFWNRENSASWPRCEHTHRQLFRVQGFPLGVYTRPGCRVLVIQIPGLLASKSHDPFYMERLIIQRLDSELETEVLVGGLHGV